MAKNVPKRGKMHILYTKFNTVGTGKPLTMSTTAQNKTYKLSG